jgi:hypothetical protein
MAGKFAYQKFSELNLNDPFFDTLKNDYPGTETTRGFVEWFTKKASENREALVFWDEKNRIGAFMYLKEEDGEEILLDTGSLPAISRVKIGTLRISEAYRGQRLGEGAIGLALWKWRDSRREEIYVTVFPNHDDLISQLVRYGFVLKGYNADGEGIYTKNRNEISYEDPFKSFPFINPNFQKAGFLIVNDGYHDTLFPLSQLKNVNQQTVDLDVANGLSKVYIGNAIRPHYKVGEPVFIYRKYTGNQGAPGYRSCFTSVCVVTDVIIAKEYGRAKISYEDLIKRIGNKSVFDPEEIRTKYDNDSTVTVICLLYYGFFGAGNNINYHWLNSHGLWTKDGVKYPTETRYTHQDFEIILKEAKVDVQNIIID